MKFILAALLSLLTIAVYAQKLEYTIKIGGGLATQSIKDPDVISSTSRPTLNVGAFVNYNFQPHLALQSGIGIANKGSVITEDAITTTPNITYLDAPLNIIRKFNFPGLGSIYLGAGGYAAIGLSGSYKFETPSSVSSEKLEFGNDRDMKRFDWGANFTAGLALNNNLIFDLRYELGLANVVTQPLKDTGTASIYNRLITVSLGYNFR